MIADNGKTSVCEKPVGFKPKTKATPVSKTGVNWTKPKMQAVFEVGVDWLAGTIREPRFFELMKELGEFFSDEFLEQKGGLGFYQEIFRSTLGMIAGKNPHGEGRDDVYFSIPGSVIGSISVLRVHELIKLLIYKYSFRFSRLDLKLDDFSKTITPELAYEAYQKGQVFGFRSHHWHSSGSHTKGVGRTLVLGRRGKKGAGKCLRIYDKYFESNGLINAIRFEAELSGDFAKDAASLLAAIPSNQVAETIFKLLIGLVDFAEKDGSKRRDRAVRLTWWDKIVNGREKIKLSGIRIKSTLDGVKRWIHNQVSPGLATVLSSFQGDEQGWNDWLWDILMNGESRMQNRHNAVVNVDRMLKGMVMG
jgi:hypothetical protein